MRLTLCICCMSKYVLHIPNAKFVDGKIEPIVTAAAKFASEIAKKVDGGYLVDATGFYKGRTYQEMLMVVYGDNVDEIFREKCKEYHNLLCQEEYAYEKDNDLIKFKIG